jgi:uncharacterized protein YndB with AHSA1/START domain
MDVRPGGQYRFIHRSGDEEFVFWGEFREVVPPDRLVQTQEFSLAPGQPVVEIMTLEERDGRTTLTVVEQCLSREQRDAILASGMEEGLAEAYDRLEELIAQPAQS